MSGVVPTVPQRHTAYQTSTPDDLHSEEDFGFYIEHGLHEREDRVDAADTGLQGPDSSRVDGDTLIPTRQDREDAAGEASQRPGSSKVHTTMPPPPRKVWMAPDDGGRPMTMQDALGYANVIHIAENSGDEDEIRGILARVHPEVLENASRGIRVFGDQRIPMAMLEQILRHARHIRR